MQLYLNPPPQKLSFCPTFPIKFSQKRGWVGKGQQKPPEGMHLRNPEIEWKSSPTAPRFSATITSQLNTVGDRVEGKKREKKTRTVASPHVRHLARPCPTPIPGEGAELGREPLAQASSEGVWWSPETGREGRSSFPYGPPHPHLRPQGPSKQDGSGGREDRVRAQALALD